MNYNLPLSLIFGGLIKTYDDIFDNKKFGEYFSDLSIELIKNFTICIYTLISVKNYNLTIFTLIFHIINYLFTDKESLNNSFFKSGMLITIFLCIVCFNYEILDIKNIIITFIIALIGSWTDHKLFPEESSIKKIIGRSIYLLLLILILYVFNNYIIVEQIIFCIGYALSSIIIMIFTVDSKLDAILNSKTDKDDNGNSPS